MAYGETYEEFVEKFKPKKTTDDCMTPWPVYEAVLNWCCAEYGIGNRPIVRPFWPGGDYENAEYPQGCVVVDNPPFSILRRIVDFFTCKEIDFFLFAPQLTSGAYGRIPGVTFICADSGIIYENGANVRTGFITNLEPEDLVLRTAPALRQAVKDAQAKQKAIQNKSVKYEYPVNVVSSALLGRVANVDFKLRREDAAFIRALDSQRPRRKEIYGAGYLISERAAAERAAAERAAAERAAAERAAAERAAATVWELSDREKKIIQSLGG